MFLLPNIEYLQYLLESEEQYRSYLALHYTVLILFFCLLILCLYNVYKVLVRQGKWRSIILLAFYIFAVFSIVARIVETIGMYIVVSPFVSVMSA